jgi:hypothetical protein
LPAEDIEEDSLTRKEVNDFRDQEQKKNGKKEGNVYSYLVFYR